MTVSSAPEAVSAAHVGGSLTEVTVMLTTALSVVIPSVMVYVKLSGPW